MVLAGRDFCGGLAPEPVLLLVVVVLAAGGGGGGGGGGGAGPPELGAGGGGGGGAGPLLAVAGVLSKIPNSARRSSACALMSAIIAS